MSLTPDIRTVSIEHYYPNTVAPSKEFKTMAETNNLVFNELWSRLWQLFANTFIYDFDIKGAARWEEMLGIKPPIGATLTDRRNAILTKINASLPYTERRFQNMLDGVYGKGNVILKCYYDKYAITLDLAAGLMTKWSKVKTYARGVIPANLTLLVSNTKSVELAPIYIGGMIKMCSRSIITLNDSWTGDTLTGEEHIAGYVARTERTWI